MYKLSQFTVVHNLAERGLPGHNLVFNTLTSSSFIVGEKEWDNLTTEMAGPLTEENEFSTAIRTLLQKGVINSIDTDDRALYEKTFNYSRYNPQRIYPLIAVTSACNIGCTYCYESGIVGKTMSTEVADAVLKWMERRVVNDNIREINPGLFGGEPLLYPKLLFHIMDGFNNLVERTGIRGSFYTSSNGMLLTPELAKELGKRGLTQIQISLDGPEPVHDQRRIGKRGEPSFQKALQGIKNAIPYIKNVTIKINFDRQNRDSIRELYDFICEEGLADKVDVKLETIALQMPDSRIVHNKEYVIPPESPELADAYLELMVEARSRNIKVSKDTAHTTPCMFSSHHGVLIGPNGSIYKCISLVGREEYRVGSVLEEDYDVSEYDNQMNLFKKLKDCYQEKCPYIPVCAGGCSFESIIRTGRYDLRYCTRENLKEYHFKFNLIKYEKQLVALGMNPLTAEDLRSGLRGAAAGETACNGCASCSS